MKTTLLVTSMSLMMTGTAAFGDDFKDRTNPVQDQDMKVIVQKEEPKKDEQRSQPKRPFHFIGHSED